MELNELNLYCIIEASGLEMVLLDRWAAQFPK
jgi:hypothetical protein